MRNSRSKCFAKLGITVFMIGVGEEIYLGKFFAEENRFF